MGMKKTNTWTADALMHQTEVCRWVGLINNTIFLDSILQDAEKAWIWNFVLEVSVNKFIRLENY